MYVEPQNRGSLLCELPERRMLASHSGTGLKAGGSSAQEFFTLSLTLSPLLVIFILSHGFTD